MLLTLVLLLGVAVGAYCFYRHQQLLKTRAHLMREAIRNHDFTFRLPVKGLFSGERALQEALNEMGNEINRLVAQNEVDSWQKLTRVLTHEIMNATAPITSISQAYLNSPKIQGTPTKKASEPSIPLVGDCRSSSTAIASLPNSRSPPCIHSDWKPVCRKCKRSFLP